MSLTRFFRFCLLGILFTITSSCNIDEVITDTLPPKIILENETGIYTVKEGREVVIAPSYESVVGATYCWTMNGEQIGNEPSLTFLHSEVGKYYILLCVTTNAGSAEVEFRVDVVELESPTVSIAGEKRQTLAVGTTVELVASLRQTSLTTTFEWQVNGVKVSTDKVYNFFAAECGRYTIVAEASNEDGVCSDSVEIEVVNPEDMPFVWDFDRTAYHTVVGRRLAIRPTSQSAEQDIAYRWQVVGASEQSGSESHFVFVAESAGEYRISATATAVRGESQVTLSHEFVVTVYEVGAFYRAKSSTSKSDWNKVYEYNPAPGQFINETKTGGFDGTQTTREAAIAYAEARMSEVDRDGNPYPNWVSLGGFGGYIVVGFDHSIDNSGDYDLGILGNSFSGSSEPGVVWVMQDENGNGLPDDTWYELAGSETGKPETIQNYAVTYYRPSGAGMPVQWVDNLGNSGEIDYLKQFHRQDYYYPLWVEADSYTLTGTRLAPRNYDQSGNGSYWVNVEYDWGYADNFSPIDRLTNESNAAADANANHFKISNAVDFECLPIDLKFIDFVKVQCAVNAKSGWLGEVSTEVFGLYDYNMRSGADTYGEVSTEVLGFYDYNMRK